MKPRINHIETVRRSRAISIGPDAANANEQWIVLHGYGQEAEKFIKKFSILAQAENLVIAPEGLSKFYLEGFQGVVGASWMTSHDRLLEIEDYVNYLDIVFSEVCNPKIALNVLGFSQGAATAARWAASTKNKVKSLTLWSGLWPPDLPFESEVKDLKNIPINVVYGVNDKYGSRDKVIEQVEKLKEQGLDVKLVEFEGGHVIVGEVLMGLGECR